MVFVPDRLAVYLRMSTGDWPSGAHGRMIGHAPPVVAQRNIHEDMAEGSLKANHQSFCVFAGLVAHLRRKEERGMYAEMKALVVEGRDGVSYDLIRQLEDGFLDQRVRLRQFGTFTAV